MSYEIIYRETLINPITWESQTPECKKSIIKALLDGFKDPLIVKDDNKICIEMVKSKKDGFTKTFNLTSLGKQKGRLGEEDLTDVKYCMYHFKKGNDGITCNTTLRLDKKTIEYLKGLIELPHEISGKFITKPDKKNGLIITIDTSTVNKGKGEEVEHINTIASYHNHPRKAYNKYDICAAYPSVDDYITFLYIYSSGYGFFHIVVCVEGLYIMSLKKVPDKSIEEFIKTHYDADYPTCKIEKTPPRSQINKYLEKINKLPYFNLQFVEWRNTHKPIKINHRRLEGNCATTDEALKRISNNK